MWKRSFDPSLSTSLVMGWTHSFGQTIGQGKVASPGGGRWIRRLQGALSNEALGEFFQLWDEVRDVSLQQMADTIKWKLTADGNFSVASAYDLFFIATEDCSYGDTLWHSRVSSRVRFFMWIALKGRCLTADNLAKRNWPHDAICSLCQRENEDCHHLLVSCDYTAALAQAETLVQH
ncbi:Os01g0149300 [Oryza sativa Japonica Group]|uniref:Os01g0149300 protein n=1 Tax=Oryza sativa subsp. japonica TaxID=39947 RepID=A0A0N7KCC1_ORYSJ|nr:Os01g0149300 [Oryza sativa Japonica Group]